MSLTNFKRQLTHLVGWDDIPNGIINSTYELMKSKNSKDWDNDEILRAYCEIEAFVNI